MSDLLALKEHYRVKYGLYIENDMGERGSHNNRSKPYWGCSFKKRIKHPQKKSTKYIAQQTYQTFDTYREALIFCLEIADRVNDELI